MPELKSLVEKALSRNSSNAVEQAIAAEVNRLLTDRGPMTIDDLVAHFRGIFGDEVLASAGDRIVGRLQGRQAPASDGGNLPAESILKSDGTA